MKTNLKFNLGVRVVRPYEEERIPELCHVIQKPDVWVAEAMKDEVKSWCPTQPVMIAAPTGSGKTTFVADICKICRRRSPGKKVLLLENRVAIVTQQKKALAKSLGSAWKQVQDTHALELVDELGDVNLVVMTYQKFSAHYTNMNRKQFDWVILDEAHYFYSDAAFNPHLDMLLENIPKLFGHAHRLYLTATPGAVLNDICGAEKNNLGRCALCNSPLCVEPGKFLMYQFPNHFDRVRLFYFRRREEIADLAEAYPEDKILIFTATREEHDTADAKSYCKILESRGVKTAYLDRFAKESETWQTICASGDYGAQVLVCTSVLDCGVSFHSAKLRHIVVESTDKTEFLQMIGRRRLGAAETLNVYIKAPEKASVISKLRDVNASLSIVYEGFRTISSQQCDKLIRRGWTDESPERHYMHLFNYLGDGNVSPKVTAYHYLLWQKAMLERLLREMDTYGDDSALPRIAHGWLEQLDRYDSTRWLDYDKKAQANVRLRALLESYAGKTLEKETFPAFLEEALAHIGVLCKCQHDNKRDLKHTALNNRLKTLGFPYAVKKSKTGYRLEHKEEEEDHEG